MESVGETVLLVVAQFWRFGAIDRKLDELSDWSRHDLARAVGFRNAIRRQRSRRAARSPTITTSTHPRPARFRGRTRQTRGVTSPRDARSVFIAALAARLGLDRWRHEIDERIEVVEAIFNSLTESLNHLQSLAFQVALELIIIAVLLLDAGLFLADALAQK